jgi:acetyltransferase-like isoleucine patch superfamily enzyme
MSEEPRYAVIIDVKAPESATIYDHVNLYDCEIGPETKIDAFVYIEEGVTIGAKCTLRPFVFVPTGVEIGDGVFVGPGVTFTNDRYPSVSGDWEVEKTIIEDRVGIGAGATILPGVTIGENAIIGAGTVVTDDIPPRTTVAGNPHRIINDCNDN